MKRLLCVCILLVAACATQAGLRTASEPPEHEIGIFYYSRSGNTRVICHELQNVLNADLIEIVDRKNRDSGFGIIGGIFRAMLGMGTPIEQLMRKPDAYRTVVFASPVWAGSLTPAVRALMKNSQLGGKRLVIVVSADGVVTDKRLSVYKKQAAKTGAEVVGVFQVQAADIVDGEKIPRTHARITLEARAAADDIQACVLKQ